MNEQEQKVKVEKIIGPDKEGNYQVVLAPGSIQIMQSMFPDTTPEEAFTHFWNLATNHLQLENENSLKVTKVQERKSGEE